MEAYPLPARPLPSGTDVAPVVDLRHLDVEMDGLNGLSPWLWCIEFVRRSISADDDQVPRRLVEDPIKGFDSSTGTSQRQLASLLDALDNGRTVAFYGWWPTPELAAVTDILGVDAMEVPTPDRKGTGLADGDAVVVIGYGRHDAFPGGGYLIVRNPWPEAGWGDAGIGYLPFTYIRAYAIALRSFRLDPGGIRRLHPGIEPVLVAVESEPLAATEADPKSELAVGVTRNPVDRLIAKRARCYDPRSSYTDLFFSENPMDVARAKAICSRCTVRDLCLARALEHREPYGVWGGEFLLEGQVVEVKRGRGRPSKRPLPTHVDEVTGVPIVA